MSVLWGQSSAHSTHPVMLPGLQPMCPPAQGIHSFSIPSVSVPPPGLQATVLLLPLLLSLSVVPQALPWGPVSLGHRKSQWTLDSSPSL